MTIDNPGSARCKRCGKIANHHRITPAGVLYCLELARHAHVRWLNAIEIQPDVIYRVPVGQLDRASFAPEVGVELATNTPQ